MKANHFFYSAAVIAAALATNAFAMGEPMEGNPTPGRAEVRLSEMAQNTSVGQAEVMHAQATGQMGMLAYETSKLALSKTTSPIVRQFAQFEVDEQTTIANLLQSMYPDMPKPELAPDQQAMLDALKDMRGAAFDRAYVKGQVDGHEKLLSIQSAYLDNGSNFAQRTMATLAKGMITQHLTVLKAYGMRR